MGTINFNCYEKTKQNDKDFDVESIFNKSIKIKIEKAEEDNKNQEDISIENIKSKKEENKLNKNKNNLYIEFDYNSNNIGNNNSNKNYETKKWKNYILNYEEKKTSINMMKLIRHFTFRNQNQNSNLALKFIADINKSRSDLLKFSEELLNYYENFEFIQNKIAKINDEKTRNLFSRSKENFKEASFFFKNLHEENVKENKEELTELLEVEAFKLPIPQDSKELLKDNYREKFKKRFDVKFSKIFKIEKVKCNIINYDPDISFLLFITNNTKNWRFLFGNTLKYIGVDVKEYSNESIFISLVLVKDL